MKLPSKKLTQRAAHLTAIGLVSATLAACGGSSSGGTSTGMETGGSDNGGSDIIPLLGTAPFPVSENDSDGDGLWDTEEEALGLNPLEIDSDFDGTLDGDEDSDGDFISNLDEVSANTLLDGITDTDTGLPVVDTEVPVPRCNDSNSSNYNWADNCLLQDGGTWATSSYSKGVQRILWCSGFNAGNATTIEGFADGIFGPNTKLAVEAYQTDRILLVDGIVGPETWGKLQQELSIIETLSTITTDAHAIIGCDLSTVQFYNQTDGESFLGWTMANTPGSLLQVPFSNDAP